jgi:anti-sigma B factor antagonist
VLQIETTRQGDNTIVKVRERRLDHVVAPALKEAVLREAQSSKGALVLDLSEVEFMDSSGLGAVVGIRKRLGWSVRVVLAGLKSPVFRVFEIARMTDVFSFYTSAEAACQRAEG